MYTDSQRLGFKISGLDQRYNKKVHESLAESRESFTGVQTPGWSSLMRSQISDNTKKNPLVEGHSGPLKQSDIYNRLSKLSKTPWNELDSVSKNPRSTKNDRNQTFDTTKTGLKGHQTSRKGDLAGAESSSRLKPGKSGEKRWNQITVHEHLYLEGRKLENKRMIQKVLDDEFKKKQILRFHPVINPKSAHLAEIKFSRITARNNLQKDSQDLTANLQTNTSDTKQKQCREVERYKILNKTFYFLTNGNTLMNQNAIKETLEELSLPCIQTLQPIIKKIYQGAELEWVDFLQMFNSKQIKQKESFYSIMGKWLARRQKIKAEQ